MALFRAAVQLYQSSYQSLSAVQQNAGAPVVVVSVPLDAALRVCFTRHRAAFVP